MLKVEIHIKQQINSDWSQWLGCLTIYNDDPDRTVLKGIIEDYAAVYGVISRLRDLGIKLLYLKTEELTFPLPNK